MPKLHIISPARNEALNLVDLFMNLQSQDRCEFEITWTIVVNNSTDDSLDVALRFDSDQMAINVLDYSFQGNLFSAVEYRAFWAAINQYGLTDFDYTMKLDCDVKLEKEYLSKLCSQLGGREGLFGGVNTSKGERVQSDPRLVRGATSCYSSAALSAIRDLPIALGYDVMDKVLILHEGYECELLSGIQYEVRRKTSSSEGLLRGRYRNGIVCRFTGYSKIYFTLHVLRYCIHRPFIIGGLAIVYGYLSAPRSPYSSLLLGLHRRYQLNKLRLLLINPIGWTKSRYFS
jgi:dolichol-phosphate mannosyltransferase